MAKYIGIAYCALGCLALCFGDYTIGGFFILIGNMWFLFGKDYQGEK